MGLWAFTHYRQIVRFCREVLRVPVKLGPNRVNTSVATSFSGNSVTCPGSHDRVISRSLVALLTKNQLGISVSGSRFRYGEYSEREAAPLFFLFFFFMFFFLFFFFVSRCFFFFFFFILLSFVSFCFFFFLLYCCFFFLLFFLFFGPSRQCRQPRTCSKCAWQTLSL